MHSIFRIRKTFANSVIYNFIILICVSFILKKLLTADEMAGKTLEFFQRISFVLQGNDNVLQFEIPMLIISNLILFRLPKQQELYLLAMQKSFKMFLLYNVFRINNGFIIAIIISCLAFVINPTTPPIELNIQNISYATLLGVTFLLGIYIYGSIIILLSITFSKITALLIVGAISFLDIMLEKIFNISLFIYHGLIFIPGYSNILLNLLLYILYIYVIYISAEKILAFREEN